MKPMTIRISSAELVVLLGREAIERLAIMQEKVHIELSMHSSNEKKIEYVDVTVSDPWEGE